MISTTESFLGKYCVFFCSAHLVCLIRFSTALRINVLIFIDFGISTIY